MPTYEEFFNQIKKPLRRKGTEGRNKTGKKINELYKKKFDSIKFLQKRRFVFVTCLNWVYYVPIKYPVPVDIS